MNAIAEYWLGNYQESIDLFNKCLEYESIMSEEDIERIRKNIEQAKLNIVGAGLP